MNESAAVPCLLTAWHAHEHVLHGWLIHQLHDKALAADLLQDVFLKALRQGQHFCTLENPRAWLFAVARNTLNDQLRRQHDSIELPDDLQLEHDEPAAVDSLAQCLPRVLGELSPADREAITCCDIEGMSQADYAARLGISLPGAKSRVQRARQRLRRQLASACKVQLDEAGKVCCFTPRPPLEPADG